MLAIATEENDLRTAAQALVGLALDAEEWTEALELFAGGGGPRPRGGAAARR